MIRESKDSGIPDRRQNAAVSDNGELRVNGGVCSKERMSISEKIRAALREREKTDDEWTDGLKICWENETAVLTENMAETIAFFDGECTYDEFLWLGEVFDDVAERTQSKEFMECLYRSAKRFHRDTEEFGGILTSIKIAEDLIDT